GLHNAPNLGGAPGPLPNPLNGGALEDNGTMIIDITDPTKPVETFHIPVPVTGGQAQMVGLCLGSDLPGGTYGKVYLLRNIQGTAAQLSGYETWDVTDVHKPVFLAAVRGLRSTHKDWWECNTGIVYAPGSLDTTSGLPLWRQSQSMLIFDWSNPNLPPKYLRTFGLPWDNRVEPDLCPPRFTVRSPRMSIPMPTASSWTASTLSGTVSTRHGALVPMA